MKPSVISFFLALALVISSSALSQDQQTATVNFSVLSKNTLGFVDGLKATDVSIDEDGDRREVIRLNSREQALSMIVLIDMSGSMRRHHTLIRDIAMDAINPLKPEDEVALIIFKDDAELIQGFTMDKNIAAEAIKKIGPASKQTFLNKAVFLAAGYSRQYSNPNNRRIIILITDDTVNKESNEADKSPPRDEVRKELIESRAVMCGLIVPEPPSGPQYIFDNRMKGPTSRYVEDTGGLVLRIEEKNARAKMNKMIDSFHKQYTLEYRRPSIRRYNRSPNIKVKVSKEVEKRHGDLIILSPRTDSDISK
ncbi:MAG TPA: VWA domain-containing protein [Blastocatellia bacterium]|nr:VWA domain-containing protein [Blastocatellia bacterium]